MWGKRVKPQRSLRVELWKPTLSRSSERWVAQCSQASIKPPESSMPWSLHLPRSSHILAITENWCEFLLKSAESAETITNHARVSAKPSQQIGVTLKILSAKQIINRSWLKVKLYSCKWFTEIEIYALSDSSRSRSCL